MQQACVVLYLAVFMADCVLDNENNLDEFLRNSGFYTENKSITGASYTLVYMKALDFLTDFFYSAHYCFSILHSVDLYVMICQPLKYEEFRSFKNIAKHLFICLALSTFASVDQAILLVTSIVVSIVSQYHSFTLFNDIIYGVDVFKIVKVIVLKVFYSVVAIRLALLTRKGILQSAKMSNNQNKKLHHRLFFYSLTPLLINILNFIPELLDSLYPMFWNPCFGKTDLTLFNAFLCLKVTIFSLGSYIYFLTFLLLFPKVRDAYRCKKND